MALKSLLFAALAIPLAVSAPLPIAKRDANPKYVVAHHMVGNTYPYTNKTWANDIKLAHASGIDAFALNVGSDSWQLNQVYTAYYQAQQTGLGFKLFISLDMTVLPDTVEGVQQYFKPYLNHPNQLMYNGQAVLSTFSGSSNTFNTANPNDGWAAVLNGLNVHFVPSFFVDPATFNQYGSWLSGMFNWNAAWPITVGANGDTAGAPTGLTDLLSPAIQNLVGTITTDQQYLNALQGKTYISSVSPFFYTHYGPNTYNKNWIYTADDHLYAKRWETLVSNRDTVDIVEVISWNDYGESHYIGPIEGAQPNSQAWVDGFEHEAMLTLTKYYAAAFKTGSYPTVDQDQLVMWARPHSRDATATNDSVGKPNAWQFTSDTLWAVALLSAPATVTLSTSPTNSKTFNLPAGANKISIPLLAGGPLHGTIVNGGQTTVDLTSSNYTFQPTTTETYNFNYYTISSAPVTSS